MRVAFYGERGSYSEQAASQMFEGAELIPCKFLTDVFNTAESKADHGVVPIENSIEGAVTQTYDLLLNSKLHITAEHVLRISHCLIARPDQGKDSIKKIYSHPQALAQCREFIEKLGADAIPYYDTAGSVKMLSEQRMEETAAIASEAAAKIYGMKVLAKEIETNKHNYTRFFSISKAPAHAGNKTSIVFTAKDEPGSLFHALNCFAKNGVNLNYLQSRPVLGKPWQYNFYVDCEGDASKGGLKKTIEELGSETAYVKVLGTYNKARHGVA